MSHLVDMVSGAWRCGNIPENHLPDKPDEWCITRDKSDLYPGSINYGCMGKPDRWCSVPIESGVPGKNWHWDGNETQPTITPSINCVKSDKSAGCGWHGWITKGVIK